MPNKDVMQLDPSALVGSGLHRECYIHPADPGRCVKVLVAGSGAENRREQSYYASLARRAVSWEMLPRFHGLVQTNLGEGAVFDLVRDYDGRPSLPLAHYLASEQSAARHAAALQAALSGLREYLLENRVITMTLKAKNILFQRTTAQSGRMMIVDNIGNSDFIPLATYSPWFARWKIRRKWSRFERDLRRDHAGNGAVAVLIGPGGATPAR